MEKSCDGCEYAKEFVERCIHCDRYYVNDTEFEDQYEKKVENPLNRKEMDGREQGI